MKSTAQKLVNEGGPDIFLWANKVDAVKNELDVELFLFNKNYTPYGIKPSSELATSLRAIFLYDLINAVQTGAATGMQVRNVEDYDGDESVLPVTSLASTGRAEMLVHLVENERKDIVDFSNSEHEFKRMKGIIARYSHPKDSNLKFYVVKFLQASAAVSGGVAWQINGSQLEGHRSDVSLKAPLGNQVLITDDTIFAFDYNKFIKLFEHDANQQSAIDHKIAEIEKHFKLSFPEGLDMTTLVNSSKSLTQKIMRAQPANITYDRLIDQADKFQLALMTDDAGAIIIMDTRDAVMFVNLLNDDYVESDMTSKYYLATKKKEVFDSDDQQINMGL